MAYRKRRSYRSKKRRAPQAWYNKKYSVGQIASKALSMAKMVAGIVNTEYKTFDTTIVGGTPWLTTGTVTPLGLIAQGSDYKDRNGDSVRVKSLLMRAILNGGTGTQFNRCIIFQDLEGNGSAPAVADILEAVAPTAPLNHDAHGRFKIIKDYFFDTATGGSANPKGSKVFEEYFELDTHMKYSNTTGVIGSVKQGQLYVLTLCDQVAATQPNWEARFRLRFIDN